MERSAFAPTRRNVTLEDPHLPLSKAHLRLEKGEKGGNTVLAIDHNIRVKPSDAFRNNFAGKANRQTSETALGRWRPSSISPQEIAQHTVRNPLRNSSLRKERKAQRLSDRVSLMADYNRYRNRQRKYASDRPHREPKANVGGTLAIALLRTPTGRQSFKMSIHEAKRQEIIDLVVEARQMAHRLMRSNLRTHSNDREGR